MVTKQYLLVLQFNYIAKGKVRYKSYRGYVEKVDQNFTSGVLRQKHLCRSGQLAYPRSSSPGASTVYPQFLI